MTPRKTEDAIHDALGSFPTRLKKARTRCGWTQEELAEHLGCSQQHVCHLEAGNKTPSFATLAALVYWLDVSADYLIGRSSAP